MTAPNDPNMPPSNPPPGVDYMPAGARGMFAPPPPVGMETNKDARLWGMLCHLTALSGFIGIPFGWIIGPLICWMIKKNEYPFVDDQGKESINFQISVLIAAIVLSPTICLAGLGILLLIALGVVSLILVIIATVQANQGVPYRYPYALRLIK